MIADLHQHRDRLGIAGLVFGRLVGAGAKFPAVAIANDGNDHAVRAVRMHLQLGPRHRDEFGFGLEWLAHDGDVLPGLCWRVGGCRFDRQLSRGIAYPPTRLTPTICGSEPVGSLSTCGRAEPSGKRAFISRMKPSRVSTPAAILAIAA